MREIAVIIADLYLPSGAEAPSTAVTAPLPGLEEAARFGQKSGVDGGWRAWLARWMDREDLARAAPAAVAAAVSPRAAQQGTVWIADPIHLIAGLTSLHLDYRGFLQLPAQDLARLAQDFTITFGEADFQLEALEFGPLLLRTSRTVNAVTTEPCRVLAHEIEASLPTGPDATLLKRLGAEMEMWLHSHPVNEMRARRGELPVSTLWLWGGGSVVEPREVEMATLPIAFGSDPYLIGLSSLTGMTLRPLPERLPDAKQWADSQRAVLVAQITPLLQANPGWTVFEALADLDRRFIVPALEALRTGTIAKVLVVANDLQLRIERRDRLRFWRRRPKSGSAALRLIVANVE